MKIALCTTTINVPRVLELYRACDSTAKQFTMGDQNGCHSYDFEYGYYSPKSQEELGWKCSEKIGWKTIARRNIAFLEALKWGADIIVSVDDDNIPVSTDYFWTYQTRFLHRFNGLKVFGTQGWFDPGTLLVPSTRHRGFPYNKLRSKVVEHVTNARIGVMAGLVLGDTDMDAVTRMEFAPDVTNAHQIAQSGVVVGLSNHTVFNAQNTAILRELVPAFFQMPDVGRHDDIYASLIVQRVAKERELHVHFGPPFVYQQRNAHNLVKDLKAEIAGMEYTAQMAELLDAIVLPGKSVVSDVRIIYEKLRLAPWIPARAVDAAMAWLEDCESCA